MKREPVLVQPSLTLAAPVGSTPPTGGAPALGDYAGWADPAGVTAFARATGSRPTLALDYLDRTDGWAGMDGAAGMTAWSGSGYRLVLGVPIIPTAASGAAVGTLAKGASGAYDGYFTTLARNLVRDGLSDAILRLGWEYNGNWFAWTVQSAAQAANFAAYWRQIVATMRGVAGEHFTFFWNPNALSPTSYAQSAAYPGDAYVDYIGTDAYDNSWATPFTDEAAWTNQLVVQYGLDWVASFAAAHGKAIAIAEWAPSYRDDGHGLGDDAVLRGKDGGVAERRARRLQRHLLLRHLLPARRHPRRVVPRRPGRLRTVLRVAARSTCRRVMAWLHSSDFDDRPPPSGTRRAAHPRCRSLRQGRPLTKSGRLTTIRTNRRS